MIDKTNKSHDQVAREKIPSINDLNTMYRPVGTFLMCIPLPAQESVGSILLPDAVQASRKMQMNEGHIVAMGEKADPEFKVGDCVTWGLHTEFKLQTEDCDPFVLVQGANIILRIPHEKLIEKTKEQ